MSVELRPLGVKCNIQCLYCYQNPQRDAGNVGRSYDLEAMKEQISKEGGGFTLFGGEPLMVPLNDLEELWSWGFEKYGRNGVQTNGTLITDDHIALFKKYRVHVGISVDGPGALNDTRWCGTLEATRKATAKSHESIRHLCSEGIAPSLIVTLNRLNATNDHLSLMAQWFTELDELGVTSARLHLMEIDHAEVRERYGLTDEENVHALLFFADLEAHLKALRFDVFSDMRAMLKGHDNNSTCIWVACDPYTTRAVRGVEGDGQSSNCGRTNKDGIDFAKANRPGYERYSALYRTPYEHGGCQGCRFFLMCKGQCPGTAIDGDWRNRTEQCKVWLKVFDYLETELLENGIVPLSISPLRTAVENILVNGWDRGENVYIHQAINQVASRRHKHGESSNAYKASSLLDANGHGDRHGDHFDAHGDSNRFIA